MSARLYWHPQALRGALPPGQAAGALDSGSDPDALLRVSAAALIARGCGGPVLRLDGRWSALLAALPTLGGLTVCVQHAALYQVAHGRFERGLLGNAGGYLLGPGLDLRVFPQHWTHGFAATDIPADGGAPVRMLAFFGADGAPLLGLRLGPDGDTRRFDRLVLRHRHADQSPRLPAVALQNTPQPGDPLPYPDGPLGGECYPLFAAPQPGRLPALAAAGPSLARAVDPACIACLLRVAAGHRQPLAWLAGTPGALGGHSAALLRADRLGGRLRLSGAGFLAELDERAIAQAWVVHRPEGLRSRARSTLELYAADGRLLAALGAPPRPTDGSECAVWRALLLGLPGLIH